MTTNHNRLIQKIKEAKKQKQKLFCAYVTLGFPKLSVTEELIPALEKAGADMIELGFPFSDPLADGPTIQFASAEAIKKGVKLTDAFALVRRLRKKGLKIPVLFFSYLNPIMHYGVSRTVRQLKQSGFDGLVVPDLPPEEGAMWEPWFKNADLSLVYLIAPTTGENRIRKIAKHSKGFVYYVSLRGVTGMRRSLPSDLVKKIKLVKRLSRIPVLVGFGVSNEKQAREISQAADGIIVGSAIVEKLGQRQSIGPAVSLVSRLASAIKHGS
ncbi:MAG: tryptophan synthase subunit alpha [Candidatus Omnitrophica bacterium]|nr:tryptophan synthase subunit alpha [Candidatus Omnitrophota bacterium]